MEKLAHMRKVSECCCSWNVSVVFSTMLDNHPCLFLLSHLCSHADLYAEDSNLLTPILAAAVHEKTEAFRCLMEYVDMSNPKQNPIFKAIEIKSIQERDFNVSFRFCDEMHF